MATYYSSTKAGCLRKIPDVVDTHIRQYIASKSFTGDTTVGEVHDALLAYRTTDGKRLMIHQLEPYMVEICTDLRDSWEANCGA